MGFAFKRPRLPSSLAGRWLLASVGSLLLVMSLLGGGITALLAYQTEPFSWEGPESQVEHVRNSMRFDAHGRLTRTATATDSMEAFDALTKDMAFQVLDPQGREVLASPEGPALDALRRFPLSGASRLGRISEGAITLQVLITPLEHQGQQYILRNARSERLALGIRSRGSAIVYSAAAATGLLAIIVFSSIALWTARQAVKPLKRASVAAAAIRPGNLTQRLATDNMPTEITPLLDAFNSALARLENGYRVQQEFLTAAAHELKTPLALLRAEIELGTADNREVLLADVDLMSLQVQQLLRLAEVSEVQNFHFKPLDIRPTIEQAIAYASRLAEGRHVHLRYTVENSPGPMAVDAGAASTLLKNLIENAIHHSPPAGVVTIRLSSGAVSVCDEGPGVKPEDVPKLFTRFWRSGAASYQGAGLGLSICEKIAAGHGWQVSCKTLPAGRGAEFQVAFHP